MKTTITIRNMSSRKEYDIQIDDRQRLRTTLQVLRENLPAAFADLEEPVQIQSYRSKRRIKAELSCREARIFSGDILLIYSGTDRGITAEQRQSEQRQSEQRQSDQQEKEQRKRAQSDGREF